MNVISGLPVAWCALISGSVALLLFWLKEFGKVLDTFTKVLGLVMILLTLYIAISSNPPIIDALTNSIAPEKIDTLAIVTLVGGTVGGYISFAGAHRLLDAGIKGAENLNQVTRSAVSGIVITGVMRTVLFLAVLGVVAGGVVLDKQNPAASVFQAAAGDIGYRFFGVVMWCAAITSVVGCAYTSVSFLRSLHPFIEKFQRSFISAFIIISTLLYVWIGNPVKLLVSAGAINGLILPIALSVILIASGKKLLLGSYAHPIWMQIFGWLVVAGMAWMSIYTIINWLS